MSKRTIGLPTALEVESRYLLGWARWKHVKGRMISVVPLRRRVELVAVRSGVGIEKALSAARWLASEGVTALISMGVAGGLHPGLRTGDLIVGEKVVEEGTGEGQNTWEADRVCTELAYANLAAEGIRARKGTVISTPEAVLTAQNKADLFRRTRAMAVDMESSAVARVAADSTLPFFALRVICDRADKTLEEDLSGSLDQNGQIRFSVLLRNLSRRPSLIAELLTTSMEFALALSALKQAWEVQIKNDLPFILACRGSTRSDCAGAAIGREQNPYSHSLEPSEPTSLERVP